MARLLSALLLSALLYADSREDAALLKGADGLYHGDFSVSFEEFLVLFEESGEPYYAKLAAQAAMGKGDTESALRLAELYVRLSGDNDDRVVNRILSDLYAQKGRFPQAIEVTERLYKQEPLQEIAEVLGNLYMLNQMPQKAQPIYQKLYEDSHSPEVLKKLLLSLITQHHTQKALSLLSRHLLEQGCGEEFCEEAIKIYTDLGGLDFAKDVFEKLYAKSPTIPNALQLMRVLIALKQFQEAQGIAQAFPFDKGLLLDLYVMQGDYHRAQEEARKIYAQSKNPKFLALEAVYEFSAQEQPSRAQIQSIAKRLKKAIALLEAQGTQEKRQQSPQDAFFYNFCGYLLIDYDLDIKGGMKYVEKALQIEPYAIAYIDSLAWGYYKLGQCERALKTFAQIPSEQIERDGDLRAHNHQIQGVCATAAK